MNFGGLEELGRISTPATGLDALVIGGIYQAEFKSLSNRIENDGLPNPIVRIFGPSEDKEYFGYVVISTAKSDGTREVANSIRRKLIEEEHMAGAVSVKVIATSTIDVTGLYIVIGTKQPLTVAEALSVIEGDYVHYAQCIFFGKYGHPALSFFTRSGERRLGFLHPTKIYSKQAHDIVVPQDERRARAENSISLDLIRDLKIYDCILVRRRYRDESIGFSSLEVVINFFELDNAMSPQGKRVTTVTGYNEGDIIHNLPITSIGEDTEGVFGIGWLPHSRREFSRHYYKEVHVIDGSRFKGRYVEQAKIISNGHGIIRARKVG